MRNMESDKFKKFEMNDVTGQVDSVSIQHRDRSFD